MTLDEIYINFCNSISDIIVLQRNTRSVIQNEIDNLNKYIKKYTKLEQYNIPIRNERMFFTDFRTGNNIFYGYKQLYYDEYLNFIQLKCNRDYQFYLASSYETFETTMRLIYAYLGKNDINFWSLYEFGNIKYDDIKKLDFNFYVEQSKKRKGGAIQIFKSLIKEFDCNIKISCLDLKTEIILIEKLRHTIIHDGGYATDKEEFINLVVKESGILNNGNIDKEIYKYIESFFGKGKYNKLIFLLDRRLVIEKKILSNIHINLFEKLIKSIVFAVYIIYENAKKHIEDKNDTQN